MPCATQLKLSYHVSHQMEEVVYVALKPYSDVLPGDMHSLLQAMSR